MTDEVVTDRNKDPRPDPLRDKVDDVIRDIGKVARDDRARLRRAVDVADAPLTGRDRADHALGNISRRG